LEERFVGKRGSRCEYEHDRGDAPGYSNKQKEETPNSPRRHAPGTSLHDPEKHALGLDPMGGNRFSEKIMHQRKI
jgi:hypothetical protein